MQDSLNGFLNTPYGFVVFFVTFWCSICFFISMMGGWFTLSRRFKRQSEPYGEIRSAGPLFYGVKMRFRVNYGNVIRITSADDALYLSMLFLFRIGHPPLRIPWTEIKLERTKFLWLRYVVLTLGEHERIPMRISERMARKLGILDRLAKQESAYLGAETPYRTISQ
jgi:hypothetical protein